jgi:type IV pilus assembly protein PilY1
VRLADDANRDVANNSADLSAQTVAETSSLVAASCDKRRIWLQKDGRLIDFTWDTNAGCADSAQRGDSAALGEFRDHFKVRVNYLRGQSKDVRGLDERNRRKGLFRERAGVYGDFVNSRPVHVDQRPWFKFMENGYPRAFPDRVPTVYVGGNDGMLHAFDAATLEERWAIMPSEMWPRYEANSAGNPNFNRVQNAKVAQLADPAYPLNHRFFVDGSPTVNDVYDDAAQKWRTILVGGFGNGGRGYYALDVSDPTRPRALWEFSPSRGAGAAYARDIGLSHGAAIVTKLDSGQWVAILSSGYNNVSGKGYVFVVDALTGQLTGPGAIEVGNGAAATPMNIAKMSAYVDDPLGNNTSRIVYIGSVRGELYRVDIATPTADALRSRLLARFTDASGKAQPITAAPELGKTNDGKRVVFVPTGKLLEMTDLTDQSVQSLYAVVDNDAASSTTSRSGSVAPVETRNVMTNCTPTTSREGQRNPNPDCRTSSGRSWYMDFPAGERLNVSPTLQLGTLIFATSKPPEDICSGAGGNTVFFVDPNTGGSINNAQGTAFARPIPGGLVVGLAVVLKDGTPELQVVGSDGSLISVKPDTPLGTGSIRNVSWREIGR